MIRGRVVLVSVVLTALVLVGLATPASAAVSATIGDITRVGCTVTTTFTVGDAGTYYVQVYDDGQLLDEAAVEAGTGATVSSEYRIMAAVLQGASGLGVLVTDGPAPGGTVLDSVDPYNGADAVTSECVDSGGSDSGEPRVSVGVAPEVVLAPGTAEFTFTRPADASADPLDVALTVGGDAVAGVDYVADLPASVAFAAGQESATVTATTIVDGTVRPDRVLTLGLVAGEGYQLGDPSSASVVITDQAASPPTIEVTISKTQLVPGEAFTIAGDVDSFFEEDARGTKAFTDASTVKVLFEDQELGDIQVQSDRGFAGTFTTPDVAPGRYTVHVQYLDSERDIPVEVLGQSTTPFTNRTTTGGGGTAGSGSGSTGSGSTGTTTLARTGDETLPLFLAGSALVLLGAALHRAGARRRRPSPA